MDEFMGSPILEAVTGGLNKNAAAGGGGTADGGYVDDGSWVNIWDTDEDLEEEEPEKQIQIEVHYVTESDDAKIDEPSEVLTAYIILLLGIIVIIVIIMIALCIYNRIAYKTSV